MSDEIDLIPLRALNQVTYCQRLYYLEYVDSVMPTNEHVEDGLFLHRRVDDPALQNKPRKDGDTMQTRSVQLSSERLGLAGKLDLVEEKNGDVYPVEYKRGEGPNSDHGGPAYWDNDAVQLCAQAMLLEDERGIAIPSGVLYYIGSKRRVEVPLDDDLRAKTLNAIRSIRELSLLDAPPTPLPSELRHRCFGCSLAPICQPEETLYCLEHRNLTPVEEATAGITRVLPQGSESAVLYVQEQGAYVSKRSEHLVIKKHGAEIQRIPIVGVQQVVLFGNVQISTQALGTLATLGVPLIFLTAYGRFVAATMPTITKNVLLRVNQFKLFADPQRALTLAKAVVKAKVSNQRTLLMRSLRSDATRGSDEPAARDMADLLTRIDRITDPAVLLGTEGQAAALYFSQFHRMLLSRDLRSKGRGFARRSNSDNSTECCFNGSTPPDPEGNLPGKLFDFKTRNRRPPRDPVNALLSFAYAILLKDCFSALCTVGFDPYYGFFHVGRHGKPSLALDMLEEFRAIIADSVVLTLINNETLTARDFLTWRESCQLTDDGRKRFFETYEQRKATVVTHPIFGYKMTYGRMLEVQARMLAAYVRGDIPEYTGFTVR